MLVRWSSVEKMRQIVREKEKRGINCDGKRKNTRISGMECRVVEEKNHIKI